MSISSFANENEHLIGVLRKLSRSIYIEHIESASRNSTLLSRGKKQRREKLFCFSHMWHLSLFKPYPKHLRSAKVLRSPLSTNLSIHSTYKRASKRQAYITMEPVKSMFDTLCTLPLPSDLFTQAIHPSEPLVAVGLASGHVQSFRLPSAPEDDDSDSAASHGVGQIETAWQTRRHKGSCRSLVYGIDGNDLFSAGTDGLVKCADTETGKVTAKIAVPDDP